MVRKITHISALALTVALSSSGAFAHSGKYLSDTWGNKIVDGDGECIFTTSGVDVEGCEPEMESTPEPTPAPEPAAAPMPEKSPGKAEYVSTAPKPTVVKVTNTYSLAGDANFANNSAELNDAGKKILSKLAKDLSGLEVTSISLMGHADSRGSDAYNMALSERRANSVKAYLVSEGVDPAVISASGKGELEPIATNETAEGRAQNRRVDIAVDANKIEYK